MHKTTSKRNQVTLDVTPRKRRDKMKEQLCFAKHCKENTRQCTDVVQLGKIYCQLFFKLKLLSQQIYYTTKMSNRTFDQSV